MRTKVTELPSYQELCEILAHEAVRPIPKGKENKHYSDFAAILELLRSYDLPTSFLEDNLRFGDLKDPDLFAEVSSMFDNLVKHILETQNDPAKQALFNNIYNYLSEEDPLEPADLIFVFGSPSTFRTDTAIRLYRESYAPRILISGKGPLYNWYKNMCPEAETLARHAMKEGIPKSALIVENKSLTVPDNIKRSLNLLEERSIPHQKIILVNSPFSQRRGWAHFNKMSGEDTRLIRCNTDKVSEQFSRNGWYRHKEGVQVILKEFFGLRISTILNTS